MRSRFSLVLVSAVIASWLLGAAAIAVPVPRIRGIVLNGSDDRAWDATNGGESCLHFDVYTPVNDGEIGPLQDDAFDGGLILTVDGKGFADGDNTGDEVGEQLTVGPTAFHGVNVLRQDRAIGTSLRTLVKFTNTRAREQTLDVIIDSNLGSDGDGRIRGSSSGYQRDTTADHWSVTSDHATTPDDPVLTFVSHGRGSVASTGYSPVVGEDTTDCVVTQWRFRVPAHGVRYLLVFTEMNTTNEL